MAYGDLTTYERAYWDEYTTIRQLKDWPGYDEAMDQRRADSRAWLDARQDYIYRCAVGAEEPEVEAGWNTGNRRARYDQLKPESLNSGSPKHEYRLPCPGSATETERVYIEEREGYLVISSQDAQQKARKEANLGWLRERRQKLWHLLQDEPEADNVKQRQDRYEALCIATHHGKAWEDYEASHNKYGVPLDQGGGGRADCVKLARSYVGVAENPANSNRGTPQPSEWQRRVYGSDGVPWCACFVVCMAWDSGVKGSGTASVSANIDLAKKGQGIYRSYTGDRSKVRKGDHVAIGCSTCHIELLAEDPPSSGAISTVGGNTSPGSSGSQYNGGCVATRSRQPSEIVGFLVVRFDD